MNIWVVAREYAGIAEAGGVKNVTCSLCENLLAQGQRVTLFIPLYGCTDLAPLAHFSCVWHSPVRVRVQNQSIIVSFSHGMVNGVPVVFIGNTAFSEKKAVYTYTKEEERQNPRHKRGHGHEDALFLNTLFQKAVAAYGETCDLSEKPDIVHCHDATAALVPLFIEVLRRESGRCASFYQGTRCIVTIHNGGTGYHHEYPSLAVAEDFTGLPRALLAEGLNGGRVEPFLLAAGRATLTTVSPQYAEELLANDEATGGLAALFRQKKLSITGITNGMEFSRYDPTDTAVSLLPYPFDPMKKDLAGKYRCREHFLQNVAARDSRPPEGHAHLERYGYLAGMTDSTVYISYHGRIVTQKGISVLVKAADMLLAKRLPVKFIFIGQGEAGLEEELVRLTANHEGDCVFFNGYDKSLARLCMAVADFAVFPSNFEPCGLEDFIAQIYGTMPVAHATGGLCKIVDEETGFLYDENTPETLSLLLYSLIKIASQAGRAIFTTMIAFSARYIRMTYSWEAVVREKYMALYSSLVEEGGAAEKN